MRVEVAGHAGVGVAAEGETALPGRLLGREVGRIERRRQDEVDRSSPFSMDNHTGWMPSSARGTPNAALSSALRTRR